MRQSDVIRNALKEKNLCTKEDFRESLKRFWSRMTLNLNNLKMRTTKSSRLRKRVHFKYKQRLLLKRMRRRKTTRKLLENTYSTPQRRLNIIGRRLGSKLANTSSWIISKWKKVRNKRKKALQNISLKNQKCH